MNPGLHSLQHSSQQILAASLDTSLVVTVPVQYIIGRHVTDQDISGDWNLVPLLYQSISWNLKSFPRFPMNTCPRCSPQIDLSIIELNGQSLILKILDIYPASHSLASASSRTR